ncbi:MAG: DUF2059 domain-containing protein [Syntrophobacterales bacterium]|jgi:hypothetical protein|nr:DUF2059 domain-containing protein [Syntrophobacterales bacterium]
MIRVKYLPVILLVVLAAACSDTRSAKSVPDTPENRTVVAKRYLEIMKPKDMLDGVAKRVSPTLPQNDLKVFTKVMESPELEQTTHRIMLTALVKDFTVEELNAMVTFYGSPAGQSAFKKFVPYMDEIMPQIKTEVRKIAAEERKKAEPKAAPAPPAQAAPQAQPAPPAPKQPEAPPSKK